jgi:hypothetical protein
MIVHYLMPFRYAEFGPELLLGFHQPLAPRPATIDPTRERREHSGASAFSTIIGALPLAGFELSGYVLVGQLGVAAAVISTEVDSVAEIGALELGFLDQIESKIAQLVATCSDLVGRSASAGRPGVLWVHRIAQLSPDESFDKPMVPIDYGVTISLSRGCRAVIGSGYSAIWSHDADHLEACVQGLFVATQAWVGYDSLSETMVDLLESAERGESIDDSAQLALTARRLRGFVQRLEGGLVDGRSVVYNAAAGVWGIIGEHESLIDRSDAYSEFIQLRTGARQASVDKRRNLLLFGLAFTSLSQTILAVYDNSTLTQAGLGSPTRVGVSVAAGLIALVGTVVGIVWATSGVRKDRRWDVLRRGY